MGVITKVKLVEKLHDKISYIRDEDPDEEELQSILEDITHLVTTLYRYVEEYD